MGAEVELVNGDCIKRECLNGFDILIWPSGERRPNPWKVLGLDGKSEVHDFVTDGGGFIGICFGPGYASSSWDYWGEQLQAEQRELYLGLFQGVAHSGQVKIADQGSHALMTRITLPDHAGMLFSNLPQHMNVVYYPDSPHFKPFDEGTVMILATYDLTGNPAMIAFESGNGRVFLSGRHPEIEADSSRDGSPPNSKLEDQGSEWPLLLEVADWLTAR
jgi:glutamine amidotransferase-like uncharacterized protein